jgi:hypothetical protein
MTADKPAVTTEQVDAINQMFTELELAYHNQFHKAFPGDKLRVAKQLWLHELSDLSARQILRGGRRAIRESAFLPTLHTIRRYCDPSPEELGLPDAYRAYVEACRAPEPKVEQHWSHPAVYHAGRESDWFFLAGTPESTAFPVFRRNYELMCERVRRGENLELPVTKALPEEVRTPLSVEERRQRLQELRKKTGL